MRVCFSRWGREGRLVAQLLTSPSLCISLSQEEDEENLYSSIQQLRDRASELSNRVSSFEHSNNCDLRHQQWLDELRAAKERLVELTEVRNRK